jgi:hypothetical protein
LNNLEAGLVVSLIVEATLLSFDLTLSSALLPRYSGALKPAVRAILAALPTDAAVDPSLFVLRVRVSVLFDASSVFSTISSVSSATFSVSCFACGAIGLIGASSFARLIFARKL